MRPMRQLGFVGLLAAALLALAGTAEQASAQQPRHFRFAYDQPKTTGYGIVGDIFSDKLKELSKGTMLIDQYPGAQLGQEPQVLQLVKSGDIDFCISASANAATLSPQAGVMSLHFLFRSEDHLIKAMADPEVAKAVKQMIEETVQGAHVIALATPRLAHMYSQEGDPQGRGHEGPEGARAGDRRPRTRCSRPTARRPCTCRSAASTPRCRPAWWMSPRTASTSISSTSTTKWRRCSR